MNRRCPGQSHVKPVLFDAVVNEGHTGACLRYLNNGGRLQRTISLKTYDEVKHLVGPRLEAGDSSNRSSRGFGAGTTYPDCKPAPHIVQDTVDGVDVVTVVTEAPLAYSGD